ncbi:MAG: sigma 54-interacting transcriptional regulator [Proteobacteria bacterium]|nr:sigma 54-interacting transcriptional regulator [Pseudomonadota bacterium]
MTATLELDRVLQVITEGMVEELNAYFARIWLLHDREDRAPYLQLRASAGHYTHIDGGHAQIPVGSLKIGRIAESRAPIMTADALNDDNIPDKAWLIDHELRSFAGCPLLFGGELLGVLAMFSQKQTSEPEFARLHVFASQAAIAIKNALLFDEVRSLSRRLAAENRYLNEELYATRGGSEIVGQSGPLRAVLDQIDRVAPTDASVLIVGETGTGKEAIARAVHARSGRADHSWVTVNCAAMSDGLVESELFGHEKGAFTGAVERRLGRFEIADRGTLFLDEVGELPIRTQTKLLRVVQEGEFERVGASQPIRVDVRIIAATNRDLAAEVAAGRFREDLLYRLSVFPITVPPLRERDGDIPLLVRHFLDRFATKFRKRLDGVSTDAMAQLERYSWPGNVRELQNLLERAAILSEGSIIQVDELFDPRMPIDRPADRAMETLAEISRRHIVNVLGRTGWVIEGKKGAAVILGLHPNTLRSRMKKLGIQKPIAVQARIPAERGVR